MRPGKDGPIKRLHQLGLVVREQYPMRELTTFRTGGPADLLIEAATEKQLQAVLAVCTDYGLDWQLVGRGSNILVPDQGYRGVVILLGAGFRQISGSASAQAQETVVFAGAAVGLSRLAQWAAERGLAGLEFAAGIPGTVGGAVAVNAGAWGSSIGDRVRRLHLVTDRDSFHVGAENLHFSYRCWHDLADRYRHHVVVGVELALTPGSVDAVSARMLELSRQRRQRQPLDRFSAGSFFKNPPGDSAGRLIEAAGLKGFRVGDAEVSPVHANFLVNRGAATTAEILALMEQVQDRVRRHSATHLEPEVRIW